MKPNKPELSVKWWTAVKPADVDSKKDLEKGLAKVEKALRNQQKMSKDQSAAAACVGVLKNLPISKITKECDKKKDKEVISGLKQLQKIIDTEIDRLEQLKKRLKTSPDETDEEEDEGQLFEKSYVHKLIKLVKSSGKELNFAFGLDMNAPEACDLLLHRKKNSEMLWKILKKTKKFPNRLMCYGYAVRDPNDGTTLLFKLESSSNVPPKRIYRTVKKLFQVDKKLRFKKLKVIAANGKALADDETDENAETSENAAEPASSTPPDDVSQDTATQASEAQADTAATPETAATEGGATETGATETGATEAGTPEPEDLRKEFKQARKEWVKVRDQAQQDLQTVKDAILDQYMDDREQWPAVTQGVSRLDEIMDNLNDDLRNALDSYVKTPRRQAQKLTEQAAAAKAIVDRYLEYIQDSSLLKAVDQKEFADVSIGSELEKSLKKLAGSIQ